jgi:hypothetical protein
MLIVEVLLLVLLLPIYLSNEPPQDCKPPDAKVGMLLGRVDLGAPSLQDVQTALSQAAGNVGKAAATLRRWAEANGTADAPQALTKEGAAAAAHALSFWNATDMGAVIVADDFVSPEEARLLTALVDAAPGLMSWDHGTIKGPSESVGHMTAGSLYHADGALTQTERALFCAVRRRSLDFARDVGSTVLLPRGRHPPATDVQIVPDFTALLHYRPGGRHDRHVDTDVPGRCLSVALHLGTGDPDDLEGGTFQAWDWRRGRDKEAAALDIETRAGRLVLFLSETPHAVLPVVRGERRAMFVWLACGALERNEKERELCGAGG